MSVTVVLIAITVMVSLAAWKRPAIMQKLIYHGPGIAAGEYWRMLGYGFIHADGNHLLFNMFTLYFFGEFMEGLLTPDIGPAGYLGFYLAGLVLAILPSHFRHGGNPYYRSLGASGAVSAVLFGFILIQPWSIIYVMFIPVPAIIFAALYVAYSIWADKKGKDKINHSAHLWGGAWGVLFLLALEPGRLWDFFERLADVPFLG